jgi:hypothetical protein
VGDQISPAARQVIVPDSRTEGPGSPATAPMVTSAARPANGTIGDVAGDPRPPSWLTWIAMSWRLALQTLLPLLLRHGFDRVQLRLRLDDCSHCPEGRAQRATRGIRASITSPSAGRSSGADESLRLLTCAHRGLGSRRWPDRLGRCAPASPLHLKAGSPAEVAAPNASSASAATSPAAWPLEHERWWGYPSSGRQPGCRNLASDRDN